MSDPADTSGGDSAGAADAGASATADAGAPPPRADAGPAGDRWVWAHSNRQLYRIDPDTLDVTLVDNIHFSDGINQMTDLAVDSAGNMLGISTRQIYSVDKDTADAALVTELAKPFNGLSFVDVGGSEVLMGISQDGELYRIDPGSGAATLVGAFGGELRSSGDLVSVRGLGTLATVTRADWDTDRIARIDPSTGQATVIGDTGVDRLYGLGFWNDKLFGFSEGGAFVVIDPLSGAAETVEDTQIAWWGAAVTTTAPVIIE